MKKEKEIKVNISYRAMIILMAWFKAFDRNGEEERERREELSNYFTESEIRSFIDNKEKLRILFNNNQI